jgi:hypothetical protein
VIPIALPDPSNTPPLHPRPSLGAYMEGGVVYYVDYQNHKALVAAIKSVSCNNSKYCAWSASQQVAESFKATTLTGLFEGKQNTDNICGSSVGCENGESYPAANAARNYTEGQFHDWYLPSRDEMKEMAKQDGVIRTVSEAHGGTGVERGTHWSSSEAKKEGWPYYEPGYAWTATNGVEGGWIMRGQQSVRPVRMVEYE